MARILVVYGTSTGHTARIARAIGDTLKARRFAVDVAEASQAGRPDDYAGEYTNWDDLRGFAELFADRVSGFSTSRDASPGGLGVPY